MGDGGVLVAPVAVPVRFGGVTLLVQATPVTVVGSEATSVASRAAAAYDQVEQAILGVAESVAGTIGHVMEGHRTPKQIQVQFGMSVSAEAGAWVVKGSTGATLSISLTYDVDQ